MVTTELSTLSPAAADATADGVRTAATALAGVSEQVAVARAGLGGWRGVASAGFADRVVDLESHLDLLTWTAVAGAGAIDDYSRELGMLQGRLRAIDTSLADVSRRLADPTLDLVAFHSLWAEQGRWDQSRQAVLAEFDEASSRLASRLRSLIADVPHRPRTLGEHVTDGLNAFAEPVRSLGFLALGWDWDRDGWESTWKQAPGSLLEQAEDPVGTVLDTLPIEEVQDGRWGAVAGAGAAAAVTRGVDKVVDEAVPDTPKPAERDRPKGPDGKYLPQTFDEMLAGVDLVRNEDQPGAHVIARHVNVDDEFLKRRLLTGEVEGGAKVNAPSVASRFNDLAIAETVITAALQSHQVAIREWMAASNGKTYKVDVPVPASTGVAWKLVDGSPTMAPVSSLRIVLSRGPGGAPIVQTAFLNP